MVVELTLFARGIECQAFGMFCSCTVTIYTRGIPFILRLMQFCQQQHQLDDTTVPTPTYYLIFNIVIML